jgi:protein involved in polysaccharide export with SLBB domain
MKRVITAIRATVASLCLFGGMGLLALVSAGAQGLSPATMSNEAASAAPSLASYPVVPHLMPSLMVRPFSSSSSEAVPVRLSPSGPAPRLPAPDSLVPSSKPASAPPLVAAPAPAPSPSVAVGGPVQNYTIHVGDTLALSMAGEPDFDFKAVVQNAGTISLPYAKEVKVEGKTVQQANADIIKRLSEYYVNPNITVDVAQYRKKEFVILGQVTSPGVYPFAPEQDSMSLVEAIAKAGGVKQYGDMGHVTVKRTVNGKEQIILVNAQDAKALSRNEEGMNFQVLPGDSVVITLFRNEINLLGEVRRPGIYTLPPMLDSIDLIEAIAMAGGADAEKMRRRTSASSTSSGWWTARR